jgi:RHS repeat-associated protein
LEKAPGNIPVSVYEYSNDALARRTKRVDNAGVTNDFGYNVRSELISALMPVPPELGGGTNVFGYAYDPIGNRLAATNNSEVLAYLANSLNQYTAISNNMSYSSYPSYDLDGNLLSNGSWAFTWDGENRLVGVSSNGSAVAAYSYDYMGRRWRSVRSQSGISTTNIFTYDGWAMISETQVSGFSTQVSSYVYGLDLSGSLQGAGTIGGLLALTTYNPSNSSYASYFYCYDANGNVTELVGTDGAAVATYVYDPYGNVVAKTGVKADANPYRFSSKYTDDETGLIYYGYRYYSPSLGRWTARDPSTFLGTRVSRDRIAAQAAADDLKTLTFVTNRPADHWDYLGLRDPQEDPRFGDKCAWGCQYWYWTHERGKKGISYGATICVYGKTCPCVFSENFRNKPSSAVLKCAYAHENWHAADSRMYCPDPCNITQHKYRPVPNDQNYPPKRESECPAYKASLECLLAIPASERDESWQEFYDVHLQMWDKFNCAALFPDMPPLESSAL